MQYECNIILVLKLSIQLPTNISMFITTWVSTSSLACHCRPEDLAMTIEDLVMTAADIQQLQCEV